ncbi:hypothetical protein [Massilia sp. LjRoot122]|uniref:hypothetical protein n=1 Tax=Massilia sp. LjRoot122 TaxID=3342257 RepID=UPI003ED0C8A5
MSSMQVRWELHGAAPLFWTRFDCPLTLLSTMTHSLTLRPFVLSKNLTTELCDFLFDLYLQLRAAPPSLPLSGRYRTFETAAVHICSWHIDAISVNALQHLVKKRTAKGLRRGHRMARKDRGIAMFDPKVAPMLKKAMLEFFFENDRVTLVTAGENGRNGIRHWSPQLPVPEELFRGGSYSVVVTPADLKWARATLRQYEAGTTSTRRMPLPVPGAPAPAGTPPARRVQRKRA